MGDDSPDRKIGIDPDWDVVELRIFGYQENPFLVLDEAFDGEFPVEGGDHHTVVAFFDGTVDDQQVLVVNACLHHRLSRSPHKEGRGRITDQMLVEIQS